MSYFFFWLDSFAYNMHLSCKKLILLGNQIQNLQIQELFISCKLNNYKYQMETNNKHNRNQESFASINNLLPAQSHTVLDSQLISSQQKDQNKICFNLFRYANCWDVILMIIGGISATLVGAALPVFSLLWGNVTDAFIVGGQEMVQAALQVMSQFFYIGIAMLVFGFLMFACWMFTGERQAIDCRKQYLKSLLRQEIGWYDNQNQIDLATQFASDSLSYQGAIGQKISTVLLALGTLISGFTIAFIKGWHMALVSFATLPVIFAAGIVYVFAVKKIDEWKSVDYGDAGGVAEQAISGIKTIKMLNGQTFQSNKYQNFLNQATVNSVKYGAIIGAAIGGLFLSMLLADALGFWYGSILIEDKYYNPLGKQNLYSAGDVLTIFFSVAFIGFNLSQLTPAAQKIAQGYEAAKRIFAIINRQPKITNCENPIIPTQFIGNVQFKNVTFAYPKDKTKIILSNFSIVFSSVSSALVGQSGCGKSTVMQLILRFYDPDEGEILLDGINLKQIDLGWLRKNIGYVGQEPVLFATSIKENLLFGNSEASEKDIIESLKKAEAYEFVMSLQQKLDTNVGYGGGKLSGGQKQRIAIARALLKNPKVLLLDEATSALDRKNEKLIQSTLDNVSKGITSITIAHRIRTIMSANIIYIMEKGKVKEKGKFQQLDRYKDFRQKNLRVQDDSQTQQDKLIQQQIQPLIGRGIRGRYLPSLQQARRGLQNQKNKQQKQKENKKKLEEEGYTSKYDLEIQRRSQQYDKSVIFSRLFSYSFSELHYFIIGVIVSLGNGIIFPLFSIFLAQMITALLTFKINPTEARQNANRSALNYVILGFAAFLGYLIQVTVFTYIGENITKRVRSQTYTKMLKMPINWFDKPRNNAGALSSRLSTDCSLVQTLCTIVVAIMVQNFSTLISGMVIAFVYQWRMALIATAMIPFMIIAGFIQMAFTLGVTQQTDQAYKNSSSMIMEAMVNIRTVTSFGYDTYVMEQYEKKLQVPYNQAKKRGLVSGVLYGISELILYFIFGLIFYFGALVIRDNYYPTVFQPFRHKDGVLNTFTAIFAIVFAAVTVGNNSHFLPDIAAAMNSAKNLFLILDDEDENGMQVRQDSKNIKKGITGNIHIKNITFKYESRNDYVFKKFNLEIKEGQKIAFVGASGCGKSTIIQLLLRFYDVQAGEIYINGVRIQDYNIHYLRSCFGVVGQQPVLFNQSFKQNILYNMSVSDQQVLQAARKANALSFIQGGTNQQQVNDALDQQEKNQKMLTKEKNKQKTNQKKQSKQKDKKVNLKSTKVANETQQIPNQMIGFDKNVGIKGSHISGGQKQRIAIARAILRKPKILLLDEATSALDSINQQKVQQSLDNIMRGKTTITVAHRLQTIRNSDCIYVFQKGQIKQSGTYQQLLRMQKYFYNLEMGAEFK